jgi:pimeloyl-ACP methyl ester carboxylesterase
MLVDLGYDVWLGNNRGVWDYSAHLTLSQNDPTYWNFTFADMGTYDVTAMISYITFTTGLSKVTYIGYARGN